MNHTRQVRPPSPWEAWLTFAFFIGLLSFGIRAQAGVHGIFVPLILAIGAIGLLAAYLGHPWETIQRGMIDGISGVMIAGLIIILVGTIIGLWILSGTIPTLVHYGLRLISPSFFLPTAFLVCVLMSISIGTSMGTVATAGVVLMGIAAGLGLPAPMTAGAILSGALFGDKMSPLSDSTNLAAAVSQVDLFRHIRSMMYTTVPAGIVAFVLYGLQSRGLEAGSGDSLAEVFAALESGWRIHLIHLTPMVLMVVLALRRVPALLLLFVSACFSALWAIAFNGAAVVEVLVTATVGFRSETGVRAVDAVMSRGGVVSMEPLVLLLVVSGALAGVMRAAGLFETLARTLVSRVKRTGSLIATVLGTGYATVILTGNQPLAVVLVGQMFQPIFAERRIDGTVASRSVEDSVTISSALVPWSPMAIFAVSMLDVPVLEYLPYTWLTFLVPIFSLILGYTGIGVWTLDEDGAG